jgi:hypothetical protein
MEPPPPGQLLEYYRGSIYIASGNAVLHTSPLRYGLYDPRTDFYLYGERVTLLAAVEDGIYISADQTYFLSNAGTTDTARRHANQEAVFPYRAVEGAVCKMKDTHEVMWLSERGIIVGADGGKVKNITEAQVAMEKFDKACLGVVEYDGHKAVVAISRTAGETSPLVAEDFIVAAS